MNGGNEAAFLNLVERQLLEQTRDPIAPRDVAERIAKGDDVEAVLEALSRGITQKMLHGAMTELRQPDLATQVHASDAVRRFYLRSNRNQAKA